MSKKTYICLVKQKMDGCDYSIACGKDYSFEDSDLEISEFIEKKVFSLTFDSAMTLREIGRPDEEYLLSEFIVICEDTGEKIEVNMEHWYTYFNHVVDANEKDDKKTKDLVELARLKAIYEK